MPTMSNANLPMGDYGTTSSYFAQPDMNQVLANLAQGAGYGSDIGSMLANFRNLQNPFGPISRQMMAAGQIPDTNVAGAVNSVLQDPSLSGWVGQAGHAPALLQDPTIQALINGSNFTSQLNMPGVQNMLNSPYIDYSDKAALTMDQALTRLGGGNEAAGYQREVQGPSDQINKTLMGYLKPYYDAQANMIRGSAGAVAPNSGAMDQSVMAALAPTMSAAGQFSMAAPIAGVQLYEQAQADQLKQNTALQSALRQLVASQYLNQLNVGNTTALQYALDKDSSNQSFVQQMAALQAQNRISQNQANAQWNQQVLGQGYQNAVSPYSAAMDLAKSGQWVNAGTLPSAAPAYGPSMSSFGGGGGAMGGTKPPGTTTTDPSTSGIPNNWYDASTWKGLSSTNPGQNYSNPNVVNGNSWNPSAFGGMTPTQISNTWTGAGGG